VSRTLDPTPTPPGGPDDAGVSVHFVVASGTAAEPVALLDQLRAPGPWQATLLQEPGAEALAEVLAHTDASHVVLLDRGDRLIEPGGPRAWVQAASEHPGAQVVVGDELRTGPGRPERVFTPLPDRFSALTRPCTSGPVLVAATGVRQLGEPSALAVEAHDAEHLWAEIVRRLVEQGGARRHDAVLSVRDGERPRPSASTRVEWAAKLAATAGMAALPTDDGELHLVGPGSSAGAVSVVLPTIGASGAVHGRTRVYVTELLDELLAARPAELAEVVVVLDVATPPAVRAELEQRVVSAAQGTAPVRLVDDPETDFDFSRKVNLGVAHARGDVLLLLNDDVEALSANWMGSMADLLRIEGVGVVGATLLYEDDTVQHAGVVAVEGLAGHFGQGRPWSSDFADRRWCVDRAALAVTGACLMTTRAVWDLVGGFSRTLPVNYNDLDFCLKARQLGLDVLVAGSARLRHFESRSRIATIEPDEYRAVASRWYDQLFADPYHPGGSDVVAATNGEEHGWPSKA
jgi:GT2 family glycosyltransferase